MGGFMVCKLYLSKAVRKKIVPNITYSALAVLKMLITCIYLFIYLIIITINSLRYGTQVQ